MSRRIILLLVVLVLIAGGIIWFVASREKETETPVLSVSAFNQTKNKSASEQAANPQDVIVYTLIAENQSDELIEGYIMEANILEITDKASLVDASGAAYNAATNSLVWTPLDIPANESINKQFSVRVNPLPTGSSSSEMKIKFNNELSIAIVPAQVAAVTTTQPPSLTAPKSGASEWVPLLLAILSMVGYISIRKYKLTKV